MITITNEEVKIWLPKFSPEGREALLSIPRFKGIATEELITMARTKPGAKKVRIGDRLTALAILVGPLDYTHPSLQKPLVNPVAVRSTVYAG